MKNNKYLFNESIDNQAYAMGLYAALEIDKEFDYIVHQKQFHFNGLKVSLRMFVLNDFWASLVMCIN